MMRAGILALQGAFAEHRNMLERLGTDCVEIRQRTDFHENLDALVLPGGESTVMRKLLTELELLEPIVQGNGEVKDLDTLDELARTITDTALCGLGKSAALPVMSTLKLFRDEYLEHVVDKKCAAHVCTALRRFVISPERCKGCSKCARNCPAGAISGKIKEPCVIDDSRCIKCGACESACAFGAIHIEA